MSDKAPVALVTGSVGGLGLAIAEHLAGLGHDCALHGLLPTVEGEMIASALASRHGVRAVYIPADLTVVTAASELAAATVKRLGPIGILVNNAVTRSFGPTEAMSDEAWHRSLSVNLTAPFQLIRATLPDMRRRNWGRIVNIGSIYSLIGSANRADYVTTKTALLGLTRAVALEVAGTGISCNAICPGTLQTPEIEARVERLAAEHGISLQAATERYLSDRQPSGKYIDTGAVTALVGLLCGPNSQDINGAAIPVDAGWSIA